MHNINRPSASDLPTSKQLLRSTLIALVSAIAILVTVVLPAEYAIDPSGIGRVLGLTEMGQIKAQLATEAVSDAATKEARSAEKLDATSVAHQPNIPQATDVAAWRDEMRVVLQPGQGTEVKLSMKAGEQAQFSWTAEGGVVNFDTHGEGESDDQFISYEKGRGAPANEGTIKAAFDGNHGWFWRNRGNADVTVTIRARGQYKEMKHLM